MDNDMTRALLAPAVVLIAWTLLVLLYLSIKRFGAFKAAGVDVGAHPGGRGGDLDQVLPKSAVWPSHNYTHLLEQPTLFYAVVAMLALLGAASPTAATLAWGYALLRMAHSVWQIAVNRIPVRLLLFTLSTLCLIALTVMALRAALI